MEDLAELGYRPISHDHRVCFKHSPPEAVHSWYKIHVQGLGIHFKVDIRNTGIGESTAHYMRCKQRTSSNLVCKNTPILIELKFSFTKDTFCFAERFSIKS